MSNYFIGDIQGCYEEFERIIHKSGINYSTDTLWICGDLVARGENSLKVLQYCYKHRDSIKIVLGNHDINLLAVASGTRAENPKDKIKNILLDNDLKKYCAWLRQLPIIEVNEAMKIIMVHAGIPPNWDIKKIQDACEATCIELKGNNYINFLQYIYKNQTNNWNKVKSKEEKNTFIINATTRMRFLHQDHSLELKTKSAPSIESKKLDLQPWFNFFPQSLEYKIIFGHWAAINGITNNKSIIGLDTGCVWGQCLTMWHYESDSKITQNKIITK